MLQWGTSLFYTDLLQAFNHFKDGRAYEGISQRELCDLNHFLAVRVRILPAGFRPVLVNRTIIVRIQKGTGRRFQDEVAIFIYLQILFCEIARPHPKCFCHALHVVLIKYRAGCLAAVRAFKAFHLLKHLLVDRMERFIYVAGVFLPQAGEKFSVLLFLIR